MGLHQLPSLAERRWVSFGRSIVLAHELAEEPTCAAGQTSKPPRELQFALERPIQNRRQQRVQLYGCFGLKLLERIHLRLQIVEVGDYATLLGDGRNGNPNCLEAACADSDIARSCCSQ